jgi:trk system potassium uptake protein TrkA
MHIIVTGCGRVGSQLAQFLSYEGHDVVIIDREEESFSRLGGGFNGITLTGIAFDEELLIEAGIETADALAAVTNFDNTNLMVAEIATRIYRVPKVISRLYNPENRQIFVNLGVEFISSTTLIAERIVLKLLQRDFIVHQDRDEVGLSVIEFVIPWLGGKVVAGDFEEEADSRILALERSGRQLRWEEDTQLLVGDRLVIAVKREGLGWLQEMLQRIGVQ